MTKLVKLLRKSIAQTKNTDKLNKVTEYLS